MCARDVLIRQLVFRVKCADKKSRPLVDHHSGCDNDTISKPSVAASSFREMRGVRWEVGSKGKR